MGRVLVPQYSREHSGNRVNHNRRCQLTATDHIVTYGPFLVYFQIDQSFIDPFIPATNKNNPLFQAVLDNDINKVLSFGEHGLLELVMATHAGMTTSEFAQIVKDWINTSRHPKINRLYKEMVFQPMLELLD